MKIKILTNNLGFKILALFCSLILWVYVASGESKTSQFPGSLSIKEKNTPEGLVAIYDQQKVKIKIRAPYEVWNKLGVDDFQAYVDLAGLSSGTYELEVNVLAKRSNVTIIEKNPDKIIVRLEPVLSKKVPVRVKIEGEAKAGFVAGEPNVIPSEVTARGARSIVENLSEAIAPVKLSGENKEFKKTVFLTIYNEKGEEQKGVSFEPESVEVEIPIGPATESKVVGVKPRIKGMPAANYFVSKIETDPATVEISGSDSDLSSISYLETKEIEITGLTNSTERMAELIIPQNITTKTTKVKVNIVLEQNLVEREVNASFSYNISSTSGLVVSSVEPNIVKVIVSCPAATASKITSNDVVLTLNLKDKSAGRYLINIEKGMLSVPSGCTVSSWLPSAVAVVLQ